MEQSFTLNPHEQQLAQQYEQERIQALARIGALSLDLEQAKRQFEAATEAQRAAVRAMLAEREVDNYQQAQIASGKLVAVIADETPVERVNGHA